MEIKKQTLKPWPKMYPKLEKKPLYGIDSIPETHFREKPQFPIW
jgi:hypothetical protein